MLVHLKWSYVSILYEESTYGIKVFLSKIYARLHDTRKVGALTCQKFPPENFDVSSMARRI